MKAGHYIAAWTVNMASTREDQLVTVAHTPRHFVDWSHSWVVLWDSSHQTTVQTFQKFSSSFFLFLLLSNFHSSVHRKEGPGEKTPLAETHRVYTAGLEGIPGVLCTTGRVTVLEGECQPGVWVSRFLSEVCKKLTMPPSVTRWHVQVVKIHTQTGFRI